MLRALAESIKIDFSGGLLYEWVGTRCGRKEGFGSDPCLFTPSELALAGRKLDTLHCPFSELTLCRVGGTRQTQSASSACIVWDSCCAFLRRFAWSCVVLHSSLPLQDACSEEMCLGGAKQQRDQTQVKDKWHGAHFSRFHCWRWAASFENVSNLHPDSRIVTQLISVRNEMHRTERLGKPLVMHSLSAPSASLHDSFFFSFFFAPFRRTEHSSAPFLTPPPPSPNWV